MRIAVLFVAALVALSPAASAEVTKVTIASRTVVADGQSFGSAGPYEKLTGTIEFALDPSLPQNARIADIQFAPRDAEGKVRFTSDLYVLRPVEAARGNGTLLFEVANRGNKLIFGYFHDSRGPGNRNNDPTAAADFGNAFLLREGYTLVWVGWQFDANGVSVQAPPAMLPASPAPDPISISFILNESTNEASPGDWPEQYAPADPNDASAALTVRDRWQDRPSPIARGRWQFAPGGGRPRVVLDGGFEPGRVYEVTYRARGAVVAGVGMAALRDAASAFQHRQDLGITGRAAYIFGASQSGRFLRQFLLDGFNVDEQNRRVFALAWPHIAGAGLGSFNERFAMPGYSSFPATRAPHQYADLLARYDAQTMPRIISTNTSVEYWGQGRAAAMVHTTPDGRRDVELPPHVRIYLLAGTQHGEAAFPPALANGQQPANPTPQGAALRALMRAAHEWVSRGVEPPASRHPRLADGTLVDISALRFPALPGVTDPKTVEGPVGLPFLVPRVDADGNEVAGIRVPDQSVPLATTTGWNFRSPRVGNPGTIFSLLGSYIPFATTRAAQASSRDPRPSLEERYAGRDDYVGKIREAATALVRERYLLEEDVERAVERANAHWQFATRSRATN
ncbi:MAG: alpha/beta hydrolase domain-containing protein [Vicinamibacterales bacterium]